MLDDGRWVVAEHRRHSDREYGPGPTQWPDEFTCLLLKGWVSWQFQLRERWGLAGSIREHGGLNDPNYQHLTCRRRGVVGHTVGQVRFSLETMLADMLRREIER